MVTVVAAAFDGRGGNVVPRGLVCDEFQRFLEGAGHILGGVRAPGQQVEAGAAAERRAVDVAGDAFAQQHGDGVLDGVQACGRNRVLVGLYQTQVIVGDHVAVGAGLGIDVTHVRCLDLRVIQLETFDNRLFFCHRRLLLLDMTPARTTVSRHSIDHCLTIARVSPHSWLLAFLIYGIYGTRRVRCDVTALSIVEAGDGLHESLAVFGQLAVTHAVDGEELRVGDGAETGHVAQRAIVEHHVWG